MGAEAASPVAAVAAAVALLVALAHAQPPADEPAPSDAVLQPAPADATAAEAESTATRRPRPPTATVTVTATATGTDTPPATGTPRPQPSATSTAPPTVAPTFTSTPTATSALLGAWRADTAGGAPWLLLGSLLTLAAVWVGARVAGGRDRAARRRGRATQASAMLLELRRLDAVLRRMIALDNPSSFPSLDHPIMEAALRDLTMFAPQTAARVAQFHSALRGIQHEIGDYRDNPLRWAGRLAELNQLIKTRAAAACRAVPELMKALEKEGGTPPPHVGEPAPASRDASQLPPPPFGPADGDDWTL